jgi:hypothetical protein
MTTVRKNIAALSPSDSGPDPAAARDAQSTWPLGYMGIYRRIRGITTGEKGKAHQVSRIVDV